jgi:prefoldin subunit 5
MSKNQEPKKPRRSKSKRLNLTSKDKWERLLKEVKKEQVPIDVLRYITVNLKDGTSVDVDIAQMLEAGDDPAEIEELINHKLEALDEYIQDVDFHISVDSVARVIQPFTDKLLKNL